MILLELSAILLFIPALVMLFDVRRRTAHDRLARTVVVYAPADDSQADANLTVRRGPPGPASP